MMPIKILGMCCCLLCCVSHASELTRKNSAPQLFHENSLYPCNSQLLAEISQCLDKKKAEFSMPELPLPNKRDGSSDTQTSRSSSNESSDTASEEEREKDRKYHEYLKKRRKRGKGPFGVIELHDDEVRFGGRSSSEFMSSFSSSNDLHETSDSSIESLPRKRADSMPFFSRYMYKGSSDTSPHTPSSLSSSITILRPVLRNAGSASNSSREDPSSVSLSD